MLIYTLKFNCLQPTCVLRKIILFQIFILGTPPYVPELDGPTDVSNFDVDDLMEAKSQVCLYHDVILNV